MGPLFILGALAVVSYLVSLRVHPHRSCPACRNLRFAGRHHGIAFTYSQRVCRRCNGSRLQERLGTRLGWGGPRVKLPGRGRGGA